MRCEWCGRFMNEGYVYTPYGNCLDEEPPDDKFICDKCYTPGREKLLSNQWRKPSRIGKALLPIMLRDFIYDIPY